MLLYLCLHRNLSADSALAMMNRAMADAYGEPSKFSVDRHDRFLELVAAVASPASGAVRPVIDAQTFRQWQAANQPDSSSPQTRAASSDKWDGTVDLLPDVSSLEVFQQDPAAFSGVEYDGVLGAPPVVWQQWPLLQAQQMPGYSVHADDMQDAAREQVASPQRRQPRSVLLVFSSRISH